MTWLLLALILNPGSRFNASLYTYQRIGAYGVTDLNLGYGFERYGVRFGLEKRQAAFGLKTFGVDVDSVFRTYRLTLGEKNYYVNAPIGATLNLWGLALTSSKFDFLLGRVQDQIASLPPSFKENNYLIGFKYCQNALPRVPVDFYLLRKSDRAGPIRNNNSAGASAKVKLSDNLFGSCQTGLSLSDLGLSASFGLTASYTGQQYGGHAGFRKVLRNYATPASIAADPGSWFLLSTYARPLEWLNLGQELSFSSLQDLGVGLNWNVCRTPLPSFGYGVGCNRRSGIIDQSVHAGWSFRRSTAEAEYAWSSLRTNLDLRLRQEFRNLQFWTGLQVRDATIWQAGGLFPFSRDYKLKAFGNFIFDADRRNQTYGVEMAYQPVPSVNISGTYELIRCDHRLDHTFSLGVSNAMAFDRLGLSSIDGRVFVDQNQNRLFDVEDRPVPEIEVVLDGRIKTRTDQRGFYRFSFVQGGRHSVNVNLGVLPADVSTERPRDQVATKFLRSSRLDFPIGELGSIEGYVFFDENKNGRMDAGEKGAPNVVLGINGFSTTTDDRGKFRFANLMAGTYGMEVKILPPETFLIAPGLSYITLAPGEKFSDYHIGLLAKERPVKKKVFAETPVAAVKPPAVKPVPPKPPKPPEKPAVKPKPPAPDVETLFQKGVAYFTAEQYELALKTFKQVLAQAPDHKGAQTYFKRTEARLEALKK